MRFRYPLTVRWSDMDSYGHANNVRFFDYFQEARVAWITEAMEGGFPAHPALIVRQVIDYRRPIGLADDPYTVEQWITEIGRSSYHIGGRILFGDEPKPYALADSVLVRLDGDTGRPLEIPRDEREVLGRWADEGIGS